MFILASCEHEPVGSAPKLDQNLRDLDSDSIRLVGGSVIVSFRRSGNMIIWSKEKKLRYFHEVAQRRFWGMDALDGRNCCMVRETNNLLT